jgi:hypothetical protein
LAPIFTGESFGKVPIVDIGVEVKDKSRFELDDLMHNAMFSISPPVCDHPGHEDETVQGLGDSRRAAAQESFRECEEQLANFEYPFGSLEEGYYTGRP